MSKRTIWNDSFIIRAYELIKSGLTEAQAARALGISKPTFLDWERKKKSFRSAVQLGRNAYRNGNGQVLSFRDYVFQRLSANLKELWNKINKLDEADSGVEKIEAILSGQGKEVRQHLFIYSWTASNFSISQALRKVNISRSTFDLWKNKDPDFAALVDEIDWHKKNFFEDHLCTLVAGGDTTATVFANRTYNRQRGYNEKFDVEVSGGLQNTVVNVEEMNLPIDVRKEILKSLRLQQKTD